MYILHIETSTRVCSVALSKGEDLIDVSDLKEGMNHTAQLAPQIEMLLGKARILPKDIGAVSVSSGPGSYTGLRVGSSTAKAMAYSLGIPLVAIPTLKALAGAAFEAFPDTDFALPMIDARRKEVYTMLVDRDFAEIWPVSSAILEESFFGSAVPASGRIVACGDGASKITDLGFDLPHIRVIPEIRCSARHLIVPAYQALRRGETEDPLHFVPYYLKPPNITTPKKMGLT